MQKQTLRLFLVRHGESADNVEMRYLGRRDEPLTEKGMRQAEQAAAALAPFSIRAIYTSPLMRTADTAARIRETSGAELFTDTRLIEGSFGQWEGMSRNEVIQAGGRDAELLARWENDASAAPPGGESLEEIQVRVMSLVEELKENGLQSPIVLVSHVGPIKALLASALDVPLEATRRMFLDPCSISVVDWGKRPFLRLFNSHAHLGWETPRWANLPGN
ncbi:MAG: histidine phosphatase family protein [Acidobacteria bacterium]|nr:histidine phosphatase family protein [Acidobacteriota bacterium]